MALMKQWFLGANNGIYFFVFLLQKNNIWNKINVVNNVVN